MTGLLIVSYGYRGADSADPTRAAVKSHDWHGATGRVGAPGKGRAEHLAQLTASPSCFSARSYGTDIGPSSCCTNSGAGVYRGSGSISQSQSLSPRRCERVRQIAPRVSITRLCATPVRG